MIFFDLYGRKFKTFKHFSVDDNKMEAKVKNNFYFNFSQP